MSTKELSWWQAGVQYEVFFLDFNGTTHETKSGETFPKGLDDLRWIPGRKEVLVALSRMSGGAKRFVYISNQGGRAWGFFETEDMQAMIEGWAADVGFAYVLVCYHDTSDNAKKKARFKEYTEPDVYMSLRSPRVYSRRKPGGGMIVEGMELLGVLPEHCVMIGDRPEDEAAAQEAGVDFTWADVFFKDPPALDVADAGETAQKHEEGEDPFL